jgi:glycine dehydrogenase subunit 1
VAYVLNTPDDQREMLDAIGVGSIGELFDSIPDELRLGRPLSLPPAMAEIELTAHLGELARRNASCADRVCFLGGGSYDHFIPAIVDTIAARGEFYTAYTPYQPEASQGSLQAFFEYQTLVCQLTGMDVSNASLYDGASATAEAVLMALAVTRRHGRVIVAESVHPEYRQVLSTYLGHHEAELVTAPTSGGALAADVLKKQLTATTACVVVEHPNFFGALEDVRSLGRAVHDAGALFVVIVDPVSLGLLERPGDYGADIVVAEGQGLGNPMAYGGPYLGILATREEYVRRLPGRIVGETVDRHGRRAFVLTLQTREQHIRREKATSNICTNQGLLALRAAVYLAAMGPQGMREVAALCCQKAHYAANRLAAIDGLSLRFGGPFFKEFVVRSSKDVGPLLDALGEQGFHAGVPLARWYPELKDCYLMAVTEKRTRAEIDRLAEAAATL